MPSKSRRNFLSLSAAGAAGLVFPRSVSAATVTPSATEGPFYPSRSMRFDDVDNDLVKIAGIVREAGGDIFALTGRVLNTEGHPIPNARVEIWQVDVNGRYLHEGDRQSVSRDAAFQGFGHDITKADGVYRFRTIKPVRYPGRTPHIHVKVKAENRELTTQFYIAGEPGNQRDGLFRRMSRAEQKAVEMHFRKQDGEVRAVVDIIL